MTKTTTKPKPCGAQLHLGLHTMVCTLPAGSHHGPVHAGEGFTWGAAE